MLLKKTDQMGDGNLNKKFSICITIKRFITSYETFGML